MNRPSIQLFDPSPLRKEGDSNPRYGYPHGSLANCWFQPLTHPSKKSEPPNISRNIFQNFDSTGLHLINI